MPSLTLKNIPAELLDELRARAKAEHRSLNRHIVYLLEGALRGPRAPDRRTSPEAEAQAAAWLDLAGQWESDRESSDEIDELYRRRSGGRGVDL